MWTTDSLSNNNTGNLIANSLFIFAVGFLFLFFNACKKEPANLNSSSVNSGNQNQPRADAKIKLFNGKGVVTKINIAIGSVELDHEEIKGSMPAMIMEFYVREKSELEVLKIGDKVEFVLEENFGQEKIISIKKIK